jgi:hypothetical protein
MRESNDSHKKVDVGQELSGEDLNSAVRPFGSEHGIGSPQQSATKKKPIPLEGSVDWPSLRSRPAHGQASARRGGQGSTRKRPPRQLAGREAALTVTSTEAG